MHYCRSKESPSDPQFQNILNDVLKGKEILPFFFSTMLCMIQIKEDSFHQLITILTKSCPLMHQNPPDLVKDVFKTSGFLIQFVIILKTIKEIQELGKQFPAQMKEWNTKKRQMLQFKRKLLNFLEKQFGTQWVRTFVEKAELRVEKEKRASKGDNGIKN